MILAVVQDVLYGQGRAAPDGPVAYFFHRDTSFFCVMGMKHDPGVLHQAVGGDRRVATPAVGPELACLAEPGFLEAVLFFRVGLHEISNLDPQRSTIRGIEESQRVEKAIPVTGHFGQCEGLLRDGVLAI